MAGHKVQPFLLILIRKYVILYLKIKENYMILIEKLEDLEKYYFPKNIHNDNVIHKLVLHSNSTLEDIELQLEDKDVLSDYYVFVYDWNSLKKGEYEYTIDDIEFGLLRIGEDFDDVRKENKKEYNNDTKVKFYE